MVRLGSPVRFRLKAPIYSNLRTYRVCKLFFLYLKDFQYELTNEEIKDLIYTIRGKQVMLDSDVAILYHYTTKNINKAVKRNIDRFPEDFCFQLTEMEFQNLRSQIGTLNKNRTTKAKEIAKSNSSGETSFSNRRTQSTDFF